MFWNPFYFFCGESYPLCSTVRAPFVFRSQDMIPCSFSRAQFTTIRCLMSSCRQCFAVCLSHTPDRRYSMGNMFLVLVLQYLSNKPKTKLEFTTGTIDCGKSWNWSAGSCLAGRSWAKFRFQDFLVSSNVRSVQSGKVGLLWNERMLSHLFWLTFGNLDFAGRNSVRLWVWFFIHRIKLSNPNRTLGRQSSKLHKNTHTTSCDSSKVSTWIPNSHPIHRSSIAISRPISGQLPRTPNRWTDTARTKRTNIWHLDSLSNSDIRPHTPSNG